MSDDLGDAVDDVYTQMLRAEWEKAKALVDGLAAAYGMSPKALAAVMAEGRAEVKLWEAEHPGLKWGDSCNCLCQQMFHDPETCSTDAEVLHETVFMNGNVRGIPMCLGCAAANDEHVRIRQEFS